MLSTTSEYALRAMLELGAAPHAGPVSVDTLAERLDVPRNYLSKILHQLAKADVLISTRGPHGGFELARPADRTTIGQIVRVFEPERVEGRRRCLLGRPECSDADPCAAHERWGAVSEQLRTFFRETTLADLRPHDAETAAAGTAEAPAAPTAPNAPSTPL